MTKPFRLTKNQEETICALAEKEGMSVSSFIDRLLFMGEESKKLDEIRIDIKTINGIVRCATEKDLAEAGRKFGEMYPKSHFGSIEHLCDYENCYYLLIKLLSEHNNWYDYKVEEPPEVTRFVLKDINKLGKKWLRFVGEYAASMIRVILNVDVKMQLTPDQVVLEIPKPTKKV